MDAKKVVLICSMLFFLLLPAKAAYHTSKISIKGTPSKDSETYSNLKNENQTSQHLYKWAYLPLNKLPGREHRYSNMGFLSFILGLAGIAANLTTFFLGVPLGILAIIFGAIGVSRHEKFSTLGILLGIAAIILAIAVYSIFFAT